jgi:hypothetical protein
VVDLAYELPSSLGVAASASDGWVLVRGDPAARPVLYIAADLQRPEARVLAGVGLPILELDEESLVGPALEIIGRCGGFDAKPVSRGDVILFVDGVPFAPTISDPLLVAGSFDWLVDAALLANEVLGRELERQISTASVEQRLRRVRVRLCDNIELRVSGAGAGDPITVYAYDDPDLPTLLLAGVDDFTWSVLVDATPALSSLLDRRMRSFETLLLRLATRQLSNPDERPSDDALAQALRCRVELVREHFDARRGSDERLLRLLVPAIACLVDLDAAVALRRRLTASDGRVSTAELFVGVSLPPSVEAGELLELVWEVGDMAELRRRLDIGFGHLNAVLVALGEEPLSNEPELRRLFEVWKEDLLPAAVDRLRRRYWNDYGSGASLTAYVEERTLSFVTFDEEWILEREDLDRDTVRERIAAAIEARHGPDEERELPELQAVRSRNRRMLQKAVEDAAPIVRAWLHREGRPPGVWAEGPLAALKLIDQAGLLDFDSVGPGGEIDVLGRAGVWPGDMERTVDIKALEIDPEDMLGEARRLEKAREEQARELRTIHFAGEPLDTAAPDFAERLAALADSHMQDDSWLKRSRRRFSLAEMPGGGGKLGGSGSGGPGGRRRGRPTEALRNAMGFASEYLVRRWLEQRFGDRFTETSWVSGNREDATTSGDGDDGWGFDFRIRLVEHEWWYEVKSSLDDRYEFEFTQNEMRVAASVAKDTTQRYRILFVPFVLEPDRWRVMELPNPMTEEGRRLFRALGASSTRFRFDPR